MQCVQAATKHGAMTLTQNGSSSVQQHQHAANNSVQQQLNIISGIMQNQHRAYSNEFHAVDFALQNAAMT